MSYYKLLGLEREPFSTSPDPEFFYQSSGHRYTLNRIMIEIRLRRGLSLILGDVGTGKTTLSRKLFQLLNERKDILFFMILDPDFDNEEMFLETLVRTFHIDMDKDLANKKIDYREAIKRFLFQKGVNEAKTIVLLIDESQRLNNQSLEVLRLLLNYETNEYKLLQLVLLSQIEILPHIKEMKNFIDRINFKNVITPLSEKEVAEMIDFRLKMAGYRYRQSLFSIKAITLIYRYSLGYPRRISMLCHDCLKSLVLENKKIVDENIVKDVVMSERVFERAEQFIST